MSIPSHMQALVLSEPEVLPQLKEVPVPQPQAGQVLVKMAYSPINPSDLAFLAGTYGLKKPYPVVPGLEGSGEVVAAGKGLLPRLWQGRRVACAAHPKQNGTWAPYMLTNASMCVPLQNHVSLSQGAMVFVNPLTVLAFEEKIKQGGHRAIVHTAAASALGKMLVRTCQRLGVELIAIVRRESQADMLRELGVKHVLNSKDEDFEKNLRAISKAQKATLALDAVGGPLAAQLVEHMPWGSEICVYGRLSMAPPQPVDAMPFIFQQKKLTGFWLTQHLKGQSMLGSVQQARKIQRAIAGELQTDVQGEFELSEIGAALQTYKDEMSKGKVLLRCS